MRAPVKIICHLLCLLSLFTFIQQATAETFYVKDQLFITVREGKGEGDKVLKTIKTGTPLEVLEEGVRYVKVRLKSGEEGYVKKQYLSKEIPKPIIISRLKNEIGQLKTQLAELEKNRMELARELKTLQKNFIGKEQELKSSSSELDKALSRSNNELQSVIEKYNTLLDKSKRVVEISNERDSLQKNNTQLLSEVQLLRTENSQLIRTGAIKWFLAGGGVFFFGWIIGKISRKRRTML